MSVLRAQKPDGTFGEIQMDSAGNLLVADGTRRIRVEKREAFDAWGVRRETLHVTNGVVGFHLDVGYHSSWVPHNQGLTVGGSHMFAMSCEDYVTGHTSIATSKSIPFSQLMGIFSRPRQSSVFGGGASPYNQERQKWIGEDGWAPIVYLNWLDKLGNPIDPAETDEDLDQVTIRFIRWLGRGDHYEGASLTNYPSGSVSVDADGKVTTSDAFFSKDFEGAQVQIAAVATSSNPTRPDPADPADWGPLISIEKVVDQHTMYVPFAEEVSNRRWRVPGWCQPHFHVDTDKVLGLIVTKDEQILTSADFVSEGFTATATTLVLTGAATLNWQWLMGKWLFVYAGVGRGQLRKIVKAENSGDDLTLTMDKPFSITPDTGDKWQVWDEDTVIWRSHDGDTGNETTPIGMSHWSAGTIKQGTYDSQVVGTDTAFVNDMVGCTLENLNPAVTQTGQVAKVTDGTHIQLDGDIVDPDWDATGDDPYLITSSRALRTFTNSMVGCEMEFNHQSVDPNEDYVRVWFYVANGKGSPTFDVAVLPRFRLQGIYSFMAPANKVVDSSCLDTRPADETSQGAGDDFPILPVDSLSVADAHHEWAYVRLPAARFNPGVNMIVFTGRGVNATINMSLGVFDRGVRTTGENHKFLLWNGYLTDMGGSIYLRCVQQDVTIYRDNDQVKWEVSNPKFPDDHENPWAVFGGSCHPARNMMLVNGLMSWTKADYWDARKVLMRDASIAHAMPDRLTLPARPDLDPAVEATTIEIGHGSENPLLDTEYDWDYAAAAGSSLMGVSRDFNGAADSQGRDSCLGKWRFANTTEGRGSGAYFEVEVLDDATNGAHIDKLDIGLLGGVLATAQVSSIDGVTLTLKSASGSWGETKYVGKVVWIVTGDGTGQLAVIEDEANSASSEAGLGKVLTLRASDVTGWAETPAANDYVFIIPKKEVGGTLYGNGVLDIVWYRGGFVGQTGRIDLQPGEKQSTMIVDLAGMVGKV